MANLPSRRYTRSDADRLELNVASVKSMMAKYHLTSQDLLTGLRYSTPKARWEEAIDAATEACQQYEVYKGVACERIEERYGE